MLSMVGISFRSTDDLFSSRKGSHNVYRDWAVATAACKPKPLCHLLEDTGRSNNAKHVAGNF